MVLPAFVAGSGLKLANAGGGDAFRAVLPAFVAGSGLKQPEAG